MQRVSTTLTSTKGTMDPEGVRATVVTAGHCTHAELTSGSRHASYRLAVTAFACTPAVCAEELAN